MTINIVQGREHKLPYSDVNIIIDVIRAFTTAHIAFCRNAKEILLVKTVEEAIALKMKHPNYLLIGEIKGIAIPDFDGDNSPLNMSNMDVANKSLIQNYLIAIRSIKSIKSCWIIKIKLKNYKLAPIKIVFFVV